MYRFIAVVAFALSLTSQADAQKPDCGCVYSKEENIKGPLGAPCTCELCTCGDSSVPSLNWSMSSTDFEAEAALALAKAKLKTVPVAIKVTRGVLGDGHTHTCANGHTWNHAVHAGHDCPVCGLPQFIQDPVPRQVNINGSVNRSIITTGSGGCANGQCGTPQRVGLFGRIR